MKKIFFLSILNLVCFTMQSLAQAPQAIPYQAVARDNTGILIANHAVSLRFTIHDATIGGTVVYKETQSATTNLFGLFTVNIGLGTVVTGTLSNVAWGSGLKFLQVELDAAGGTSYTDMGAQQMMSVPYALHAANGNWTKTGNDIYNSNTGNVGIGTLTPSAKLEVNGQVKISGGTPGVGKVLTSDANGLASWVTPGGIAGHFIGESYGGGIVFYIYDNGQHGLIAATSDQSTGIQWYNGVSRNTSTTGDGLIAGEMNTALIIATQMADNQTGNFAAKVCADYSVTVGGITYGDWYLPSKYELNLMYSQKNAVGTFSQNYYWSSTEDVSSIGAWFQLFNGGTQNVGGKNAISYVRAVRAF